MFYVIFRSSRRSPRLWGQNCAQLTNFFPYQACIKSRKESVWCKEITLSTYCRHSTALLYFISTRSSRKTSFTNRLSTSSRPRGLSNPAVFKRCGICPIGTLMRGSDGITRWAIGTTKMKMHPSISKSDFSSTNATLRFFFPNLYKKTGSSTEIAVKFSQKMSFSPPFPCDTQIFKSVHHYSSTSMLLKL